MFWLDIIGKIFKVLKAGATPSQIAWGFALGFAIGMVPGWPLHIIALFALLLLLNVNLTMALVAMALASVVAWVFDPWLDQLGVLVLKEASLQVYYTQMYNNPLLMLTRFNNTVVMGATVGGLLALLPLFIVIRILVKAYREQFLQKLNKIRIVQWLRGSRIFGFYQRVSHLE